MRGLRHIVGGAARFVGGADAVRRRAARGEPSLMPIRRERGEPVHGGTGLAALAGSRGALLRLASLGLALLSFAPSVQAQVLLDTAIAPDYRKGRNISVEESRDPAYQPIPLRIGSLDVLPSVTTAAGATTNVYTSAINKTSDGFFSIQPSMSVRTNWAVHEVSISGNAEVLRYAHENPRNQTTYYVVGTSRLDLGREFTVTGGIEASHAAENPFSDGISISAVVLSQYDRLSPFVRMERQVGRTRFIANAEFITLRFNTLRFTTGTVRSQKERDSDIARVAVQGEFAVSPSVSIYAKGTFDQISFLNRLPSGGPNRDSRAFQLIGGVNFDLSGFMRGTVGIGYTQRNYGARVYKDVSALSVQSKIEYFLSPITTLTMSAQQLIQDVNLGNAGAFRDTRLAGKVDHALLRNLILSADAAFTRQKLLESGTTFELTTFGGTASYQSSRFLELRANVQYAHKPASPGTGPAWTEIRAQLGVVLRK